MYKKKNCSDFYAPFILFFKYAFFSALAFSRGSPGFPPAKFPSAICFRIPPEHEAVFVKIAHPIRFICCLFRFAQRAYVDSLNAGRCRRRESSVTGFRRGYYGDG